jgi:hypothetical protein
MCHNLPAYFIEQYKLYTDLLASYRDGEYGALLTPDLKLSKVKKFYKPKIFFILAL